MAHSFGNTDAEDGVTGKSVKVPTFSGPESGSPPQPISIRELHLRTHLEMTAAARSSSRRVDSL